jgi:hypothetical protein
MRAITFFIIMLITVQLNAQTTTVTIPGKFKDLIPVLNVGTFHMAATNDGHTTEFDEHNNENVKQAHEIAKMIAAFKPTVIIVELLPKYNTDLQKIYEDYLKNPEIKFENPSEVELLAYEVGRLSGAKKIYGIDYKESYNWNIGNYLRGKGDSATYNGYEKMMDDYSKAKDEDKMPLIEMIRMINSPAYMDFMINANADILTHVATAGKAEGADEAAKYYHRNLVMYSNLNQIPLTKDDRVFILMGASHTAFFNDFMKRSPKYQLVNTADYLK